MPKISIIVPVYNVEKFLKRCLDSLVNQTLEDIEIIVVDDGSPDESYVIYEEFAARDSRIKIIKKENAGVSEARNTGIDAATGDFLVFVDSDDWMELDGCEILYNEYLRTKADLIVADVIVLTNEVPKRNHIFKDPFTTTDPQMIRTYQKTCIGYCYNPNPKTKWNIPGLGSPWNKLYKREIVAANDLRFDPYVKGIYDDNLFALHYMMHIKSLSYVKEPVYDFRIVENSLTQGYKANTLEINRRIFEKINEFMDETGDRAYFEEAFYVYVIRRFSKSLNVYFFTKDNNKSKKEMLVKLKRVMNSEPYKTAIKKVDWNRLLNNHKVVVLLARLNNPYLLWLGVKLKNLKRDI